MASKKKRTVRAKKPQKGILFTNPFIASQVGSAVGATLMTMYVENPKILSNAFDELLPLLVSFGREFEREDVLGLFKKKDLKLKDLPSLIAAKGHVRPLDVKKIKEKLSADVRTYVAAAQMEDAMRKMTMTREDWHIRRGSHRSSPTIANNPRRRGKGTK